MAWGILGALVRVMWPLLADVKVEADLYISNTHFHSCTKEIMEGLYTLF